MPTKKVFTLKGNIPSVKNSKIAGAFPSKTVQKWLRSYGIKSYNSKLRQVVYFKRIKPEHDINELINYINSIVKHKDFKYPLCIGFHFIRGTKHKCDFFNLGQIIADLLVALNLIEDDSLDYFMPYPLKYEGKYHSYNKTSPGVLMLAYSENEES